MRSAPFYDEGATYKMRTTITRCRELHRQGAATQYSCPKKLACVVFLVMSLLGGITIAEVPAPSSPSPSSAVSDLEREKLALEVEKLRAEKAVAAADPLEQRKLALEVEKLQLENASSVRDLSTRQGWLNLFYSNVSLFTALFVGAWALYKYLSERTKGRLEREEGRFEQIVRGLGSEHDQERVSSAVLLPTFLQPQYRRFYVQVFNLAAGNLRVRLSPNSDELAKASRHDQSIDLSQSLRRSLLSVFRESYPKARDSILTRRKWWRFWERHDINPSVLVRGNLNAAHVCLDHAFLDNADLNYAWLREASLQRATLKGARLEYAVLERGDLSGAVLDAADLSNANLKGADFTEASLVHSDFSGARVDEAVFNRSKLANATFYKCTAINTRFTDADLTEAVFDDVIFDIQRPANLESAQSLKGAVLKNVRGLTSAQVARCEEMGARFEGLSNTPKALA